MSATLSVKLMKDIFKSSPTREELYALIDLWDSKKPNISDSTSSNFLFQEVLKILSVKVEDEDRYSITLIEDNQSFKLSVSTMDFEYLMRAEQLLQKTANIVKIKQKGKIRPETLNMLSSRVSRETNHRKYYRKFVLYFFAMYIFLHIFAQKFVEIFLEILALREYYRKHLGKFLRCGKNTEKVNLLYGLLLALV